MNNDLQRFLHSFLRHSGEGCTVDPLARDEAAVAVK